MTVFTDMIQKPLCSRPASLAQQDINPGRQQQVNLLIIHVENPFNFCIYKAMAEKLIADHAVNCRLFTKESSSANRITKVEIKLWIITSVVPVLQQCFFIRYY